MTKEERLAIRCGHMVAYLFRMAGYTVSSVEIVVRETPARALAYASVEASADEVAA